jgi:hypothetical protein
MMLAALAMRGGGRGAMRPSRGLGLCPRDGLAPQVGPCAVVHLVLATEVPTYRGAHTPRAEMVNVQPH